MAQPELAVLVSTFERPWHLQRVLASIAAQQGVAGAFEVVVTDDGSRDETPDVVRRFADAVDFPVHFTTHPHRGFQLARCRNEGVAASTAPYLLFLDGDCLIPPDHLRVHLDRRRRHYAVGSYCLRLARDVSERISERDVLAGRFCDYADWQQRLRLRFRHVQASFYLLMGDSTRPKLFGGNIGIAREDYERVNGYDENFSGWGCEDDDLRLRLRAAGIRVASISGATNTYHLWHPKTPSAPRRWREGANVEYLNRPVRLTRCLNGLAKRRLEELCVRLVGPVPPAWHAQWLVPHWVYEALERSQHSRQPAEVELAFAGAVGGFSQRCPCRVLVVDGHAPPARRLLAAADLIFAARPVAGAPAERTFAVADLDTVLRVHLGAERPVPAAPAAETSCWAEPPLGIPLWEPAAVRAAG